ncbi:MAG: RIO1 family regulatory kinase/ATPase [Ktedonobacterales bacterium]
MNKLPASYPTDADEDAPPVARPARGRGAHRTRAHAQSQPAPKASYESSADVQLWLRDQALDQMGVKPPFAPTFLAGQRDSPWVLSSLTQFYEEDLIADVLGVVKSGKEATVYWCAAGPDAGPDAGAAAKVYRPRMFRGLKNDVLYRESRPIFDGAGHEVRARRDVRGALKKTERGRAVEVSAWIHYEYLTQRLLYDAGADVPRPLAQRGNALLMAYIGAPGDAAPLLARVRLDDDEAHALFARVLRNIELFLACERVHGDLSAYNVLYWQGEITIIDFAQAVDPRYSESAFAFLERDIERVCRYFARFGVRADAGQLASEMWARHHAAGR